MDLELDLGKILKCILIGKLRTIIEMVLKAFVFSESLRFSDTVLLRF